MPARRLNVPLIFAAVVIAAAILLTAYHGSVDWMSLLVFLSLLLPKWRRTFAKLLERKSDEPTPFP